MARVRRWVVAAGVALLVTGCSADPKPRLSEPSETPAVTSTPSPTASAEPEPWEVRSKNGAYAFVAHWLDAVTEASNSGETSRLANLGTGGCETCSAIVDYIDEVYAEGGSIRVDPWRVLQEGEIPDGVPLEEAVVPIRVLKPLEVVQRTEPRRTVRVPAERYTMTFELRWNKGRWFVNDADRVG